MPGRLDGLRDAIFPAMTAMSTASTPTFGLQDYVRSIDAVLRRRPANPVIIH